MAGMVKPVDCVHGYARIVCPGMVCALWRAAPTVMAMTGFEKGKAVSFLPGVATTLSYSACCGDAGGYSESETDSLVMVRCSCVAWSFFFQNEKK